MVQDETHRRPLIDVLSSGRPEAAQVMEAVRAALNTSGARSRELVGAELNRLFSADREPSGEPAEGFVVVYDPDDSILNYALGNLRGMRRPVLLVVLKEDGRKIAFDLREFRFAIFDAMDPEGSTMQINWAIRLLVDRPAAA